VRAGVRRALLCCVKRGVRRRNLFEKLVLATFSSPRLPPFPAIRGTRTPTIIPATSFPFSNPHLCLYRLVVRPHTLPTPTVLLLSVNPAKRNTVRIPLLDKTYHTACFLCASLTSFSTPFSPFSSRAHGPSSRFQLGVISSRLSLIFLSHWLLVVFSSRLVVYLLSFLLFLMVKVAL